LLAIVSAVYLYSISFHEGPSKTAKMFMTSLAHQDWQTVSSITSGKVLATIEHRESSAIQPAKIVDLATNVKSSSKQWSCVQVTAETKLTGDDIDVLWYDLNLRNTDEGWKIYQATPTMPTIKGTDLINQAEPQTIKAIEDVFKNYLTALTQNKYQEAGKFLVGLSRQIHESKQYELGKSPLITEFKNVKATSLWNKGKIAAAHISYTVDGRETTRIVTFYKASNGWRIVDITPT